MPKETGISVVEEIVLVPIDKLIPRKKNPRRMTAAQKSGLTDSLRRIGFAMAIQVSSHPGRENVVINGHQRLKIAKELNIELIPCTFHDYPPELEDEANIRFNQNQGEYIPEQLLEQFEMALLLKCGFDKGYLESLKIDDMEKVINKYSNDDVPMPIVPKFTEKYRSVVIFCDNELDENWLLNVLQLTQSKCYKTGRIGQNYVITAKQLQAILQPEDGNDE